ncbi:Protein of unknown function (DUF3121) [Idiomarina sp. A28L]|uniref:hypothetical protein n=1 Tax=Idiomarina sp. A28L TaxID=1036674 RepID=UPI0002138BA6|nr:hypothetical protein [Idiomarina sp. A28L]EGN75400.1 Protein of unknown function (DUF3121) [Idiomarina sp. A28L]
MKQTLNHFSPKRLLLTGAVGLCMMAPAVAQEEKPSLAEQMQECAAISNAIERLVCFDDLVASLPRAGASRVEGAQRAAQAGARGQEQAAEAAQRGQETAASARAATRGAREAGRSGRDESLNERERAAQERIEAAERRAAEAEERLARQQAAQQRAAEEAARNQPPSEKTYITIEEAWQSARGLWRFRLDNGQEWHQTSSEAGVRYREGARYYIEPGRFGSYFLGSDDNNRRMRIHLVD